MEVATFQGEIINGKIRLAKDVQLPKNAKVYVVVSEIVHEPAQKKFDLAEMVSRMPADYTPSEEDFGNPLGKEVW
jgi:antitoxin component of MazEF toxin-antitoxin module